MQVFSKPFISSAAAVALSLGLALAHAQDFPTRTVKVVVPTGAGGPSDLCMRVIAPAMQAHLGQSIVVENVTGATGSIGLTRVASTPPDGYTLALPSAANTASFAVRPQRSMDLEKDLVPVGKTCQAAQTLVVSPKLGIKSVAELIKYGRANPGKLSFASIGPGSSQHLMGELFAAATGIDMVHVPFRGESAAAPEIAAGRVSLAFMAGAKPFVDGDLVVALATTNAEVWPAMPNLPPLRKTAPELANVSYNGWNGLMAPKGTPPAVVRKLSEALQHAVSDEKTRASIMQQGNMPGAGTPEELAKQLASDRLMFKRVIEERKLTFTD
jgi:tripartite-type tricarboxylate transporter receptor subunit TctC